MAGTRLVLHTAALLAAFVGTASLQAATRKELAAEHYRKAATLLEDLQAVPAPELEIEQYRLVIDAFRRVHRTTPASGYCDDALYYAAETYRAMIERFGADPYRGQAVAAYRYMARQYPQSKWTKQALALADALEKGSPAPKRAPAPTVEPAPASGREPAAIPVKTAPASGAKHRPQTMIEPPRPSPQAQGTAAVTDIRYHSGSYGTRIVLTLDRQVRIKYDLLQKPERLYFDLFDSRVARRLLQGVTVDIDDDLVKTARLAQNRRTKARLVLDLKRSVTMDLLWLDNPARLAIDVRDPQAPRVQRAEQRPPASEPSAAKAESELAPPQPAAATAGGKHSLIRALGLKISRIVIDAGHGGHDTGSIGQSGLREKEVSLAIAQRLGDLLEERLGAGVIYTRTSDEFVPLEERTRIANSEQADLFVSVHCNSARNRSVRGIETYYLNFTADSWALNVASRENAAADRSVHDLQDLVSKIALKEKIDESREFATRIQNELYSGLSLYSANVKNRGIRKAPFVVLIGAKMPAVLAEIGFISNKTDENLMKTAAYRAEVAEYLFEGIVSYAASLGTISMKVPDKETPAAARLD